MQVFSWRKFRFGKTFCFENSPRKVSLINVLCSKNLPFCSQNLNWNSPNLSKTLENIAKLRKSSTFQKKKKEKRRVLKVAEIYNCRWTCSKSPWKLEQTLNCEKYHLAKVRNLLKSKTTFWKNQKMLKFT